jgi:hypothetical protein
MHVDTADVRGRHREDKNKEQSGSEKRSAESRTFGS